MMMNGLIDRIGEARILVVGDVMLDRYWFGEVDRISPEAPVPVVRVTKQELRLGGAANVARNIAALGAHVCLMGLVGEDEAGRQVRDLMAKSGIGDALTQDARLSTTLKLRVNGRAQQLLRIDFEEPPPPDLLERKQTRFGQRIDEFDSVVFSDYGKGGLTAVAQMIAAARARGKPVLVDPKGADYTAYRGATAITPNRAELSQVVGQWRDEADLRARAERLRKQLELGALMLTRSEEGLSVFDREGCFNVAADAREIFDVTGAGDTVIATLAVLMAGGAAHREAAVYANRAGGMVVGRFGTAAVTLEEILA